MAYLGRNPAIGTQKVLDSLESQFNGTLTTFNLRYTSNVVYPTLSSSLIVSLGGVLQEPGTAYDVASDQITFASAPSTGTDCWILLYSEFGAQAAATPTLTVANNAIIGGELHGPANFIIDPAVIGANTGTVEIKGNLTVQGTTTTINSTTVDFDHLSLGDNEKANFGDNDDLQISHNGVTSIISGMYHPIEIRHQSEVHIKCVDDGSVTLYHDNSPKFETTASGATVTGNFGIGTASPTSYGNSQKTLVIEDDTNPAICISDTGQAKDWWLVGQGDGLAIKYADGGGSGSASNVVSSIFFKNNGDVGIGQNSPGSRLDVNGLTKSEGFQANSNVTPTTGYGIEIFAPSSSQGMIQAFNRGGGSQMELKFRGSDITFFGTSSSDERVRITGAGNLGIGNNGGFPIYTGTNDRTLILGTGSEDSAIQIHSGTSNYGGLYFGDATSGSNRYRGYVEFKHGTNDDFLRFGTGATERLRIDSDGHVTPGDDDTQDLGSTSKRWRNIYTGDLQLSNEGSSNEVDGTWGNYTIQEGEEELFIINRRSGKKFKFVLEEVK